MQGLLRYAALVVSELLALKEKEMDETYGVAIQNFSCGCTP